MSALQYGQRIGRRCRHDAAARIVRPTDDQTDTLNRDLRQRQRPIDSSIDVEVRGIEIGVRPERNVNAIESETGFVDGAGSKVVCFTDREDLPLAAARVAEAWNALSTLRRG